MTFTELRNYIYKKYRAGQTVNMSRMNFKNEVIGKYKVKILKFYPFHVSLLVGGYREGYTYYDFLVGSRKR